MGWRETTVEKQRERFILAVEHGQVTMSEICQRFGISRKTGYKWWNRYCEHGLDGLADASRAPHEHPFAVSDASRKAIIALRKRKPTWGPEIIRKVISRDLPALVCPAASTIGTLLKREGLVRSRKRRPHVTPNTDPLAHADAPNVVWSADFKGQFRTGDGYYCYPLTVTDNFSRYIFTCAGMRRIEFQRTQRVFEKLFTEFGLPQRIRTDNGVPFASQSLGGLSRLSIWFIRLGIIPERTDLGSPQQNGRHERMHRTMKAEVTRPSKGNLKAQNTFMEKFRVEFNEVRPHRALDMDVPANAYYDSPWDFPETLSDITYPDDMEQLRVRRDGCLRMGGKHIFLGGPLAGETIGLRELEDGGWDLFFSCYRLGRLVEGRLIRAAGISGNTGQ